MLEEHTHRLRRLLHAVNCPRGVEPSPPSHVCAGEARPGSSNGTKEPLSPTTPKQIISTPVQPSQLHRHRRCEGLFHPNYKAVIAPFPFSPGLTQAKQRWKCSLHSSFFYVRAQSLRSYRWGIADTKETNCHQHPPPWCRPCSLAPLCLV